MTKRHAQKRAAPPMSAVRTAVAPRDIVGITGYDHHCHVPGCTRRSFGIPIPREHVPKSITFVCRRCAAAFLAGADLVALGHPRLLTRRLRRTQ